MYRKITTNERGSAALPIVAIGAVAGTMFANLVAANIKLDHANDFAEDVQAYNPQVKSQLQDDYPTIEGLVLTDEGKTLRFTATDPAGNTETCKGHYEVQNDQAQAVGGIACTSTVQVAER